MNELGLWVSRRWKLRGASRGSFFDMEGALASSAGRGWGYRCKLRSRLASVEEISFAKP